MQVQPPMNYVRRAIGISICLIPTALCVASLVAGLTGKNKVIYAELSLWLALLAFFIAAFNFSLSSLRPRLLRWKGKLDGRHISGIPVVGSLMTLFSGILGFGAPESAIINLVAMVFDTGGSPWFLYYTWRDSSFWDA
jgi:hypothetical protein